MGIGDELKSLSLTKLEEDGALVLGDHPLPNSSPSAAVIARRIR